MGADVLFSFSGMFFCATAIVALTFYLRISGVSDIRWHLDLCRLIWVTALIGVISFWPYLGVAVAIASIKGILSAIILLGMIVLLTPSLQSELRLFLHQK